MGAIEITEQREIKESSKSICDRFITEFLEYEKTLPKPIRNPDHLPLIDSMKKQERYQYLAKLVSSYFEGGIQNDAERAKGTYNHMKTVARQLKESGIIEIERYPILQQFLFYIAYFDLTSSERVLVNDVPVSSDSGEVFADRNFTDLPNRKLIDNLKKGHVNQNFYRMGIRFLSLSQSYEWYVGKRPVYECFDEVFFEDYNIEAEAELPERFAEWVTKRFLLPNDNMASNQDKQEQENFISMFCDDVYITIYRGQSSALAMHYWKLCEITALADLVQAVQQYACSSKFQETLSVATGDAIYRFLFDLRYWTMLIEPFHMRNAFTVHTQDMKETDSIIHSQFQKCIDGLKKQLSDNASLLKEAFKENILLAFGGSLILKQEKNRYQYEVEILNGLMEEVKRGAERRDSCEVTPMTLTEELIDSDDIDLLDLIVPRKNERKAGDRNKDRIRKKTKETIQVLHMLKERYGVVDDERNSSNIRMMYEELFQYNQFRCKFQNGKKEKSYSFIISNVVNSHETEHENERAIWCDTKSDLLPRDERLLLKEKCLRGKYRERNAIQSYIELVKQKREILKSAIEILESLEV